LKRNIEINNNNKKQLVKIADLEKNRFNETKDSLYFISYKYALLFTFDQSKKDRIDHFVTLTELWRANNNKHPLIITDVNFSMALHFENYSSKLSFYYLNLSIDNELKIKNSKSLAHLYHVKGRLYYNDKNYKKANEYFTKALRLYSPSDYLYISSMHNNFGLVYQKQEKNSIAINEFKKALQILANKKTLTNEEYLFFLHINENLTKAYLKNGNKKEAQLLAEKLFNENKNNSSTMQAVVRICKNLYKIYQSTQNKQQIGSIINYLKDSEKNRQILIPD